MDLHQLGSSLELDNVRMQDILSLYGVEEQHQRVMELWFRTEGNPTWEKLYASMPRRDSLTGSTRSSFSIQRELSASESMQSASPTPISPDQKSKSTCIVRHSLATLRNFHIHYNTIDTSLCSRIIMLIAMYI